MCDPREMELVLSRMIDGDLNESEQEELQRHLASCPACRQRLQELSMMQDAFSRQQDPPAALREQVMTRIRQEPRPAAKRRRRQLIMILSSAACLVLVTVAALWGGFFPSSAPRSPSSLVLPENQSALQSQSEQVDSLSPAAEQETDDFPAESGQSNTALHDTEKSVSASPTFSWKDELYREDVDLDEILDSYAVAVVLPVFEGTPFDEAPYETIDRALLTGLFPDLPEGESFLCIALEEDELLEFYQQRLAAGYADGLLYRQEEGEHAYLLMPLG